MIALFSSTTNHLPIGGFFSTASFRLRACLKRIGRNCQRYFWFSAYHATAAMKATTARTAKKILRKL